MRTDWRGDPVPQSVWSSVNWATEDVDGREWATRCALCGWVGPAGHGVVTFLPLSELPDGRTLSVPVVFCEACNLGPHGPNLVVPEGT